MSSVEIRKTKDWRLWLVHSLRLLMLLGIIACIHFQYRKIARHAVVDRSDTIQLNTIQDAFPLLFRNAASLVHPHPDSKSRLTTVLDDQQDVIGFVVQTSPESDHISGFSGPTNVLIAFDTKVYITGLQILSSGDTRDHVEQIENDPAFLQSLNGKNWDNAPSARPDAVTGATLTSFAIMESIAYRLGGDQPSQRFPEQITVKDLQPVFPEADSIIPNKSFTSRFQVYKGDEQVGSFIDSSKPADNHAGYQGPTRTLVAFDADDRIAGLIVGKSYDNEPYVTYVRDEEYFLNLFNGLTVSELATLDFEEYQVEGVSGATMTSMAVAEGIQIAANENQSAKPVPVQKKEPPRFSYQLQDMGTILVLLFGSLIAFTSLRGRKWLRLTFQVVVIGYLGFINGALISQVMLVGWAQNGIPYRSAIGLVLLTLAAFAIPIVTKNNIYCSHLCPHGALQQIARNRFKHVRLSRRVNKFLSLIPAALLLFVVVVAMFRLPVNLVDIEPFDAYMIRIAGWSSIVIAIVGLFASLFIPMAYCRFGCPTGALIGYTRFHARADKIGPRDWFAGLVLAGCLTVLITS